ncbi:MAG: isoprenylcysteine carboxylmethyltransferase family protein [Vallitaleaceae bacterium]|jgi:protein-S-isoprenylcysteine O-methyltransferase Ste14|nr:isoprenylcysteine carboxylmethyltransferase family protein [Vallitaleaceae bacterium]
MSERVRLNTSGRKAILVPFVWLLLLLIVYYLCVGSLESIRGFIYFLSAFIITTFNSFYMWLFLPGLTNERGDFKEDTKPIDKVYLSLFILFPAIVTPFVAGIEMRLLGSAYFGNIIMFLAIGLYIIGYALNLWAMSVNRHFEGTVRIQNDRDHKVITSGPYSYVRHPGYIAMIIGVIVGPLILGSIYALVPAILTVIVIISRTAYEDKTLHDELEGYKEYASNVRYRLIPWIW